MEFYGYGYRKNCFGERLFFTDNMSTHPYGTTETVKQVLSTAFATMKRDTSFSFNVCTDNGECYAITEYNKETDTYTVVYSKSWNNASEPLNMSKKAITAKIMQAWENE